MIPTSTHAPSGAAWAAILAAGIGCAGFGIIVDLAEAFPRISKDLNIYNPSGDLSGKSTLAVLLWIGAWLVLHLRWKHLDIARPGRLTLISLALILLGFVAVLPPFIELFART